MMATRCNSPFLFVDVRARIRSEFCIVSNNNNKNKQTTIIGATDTLCDSYLRSSSAPPAPTAAPKSSASTRPVCVDQFGRWHTTTTTTTQRQYTRIRIDKRKKRRKTKQKTLIVRPNRKIMMTMMMAIDRSSVGRFWITYGGELRMREDVANLLVQQLSHRACFRFGFRFDCHKKKESRKHFFGIFAENTNI